MLCTSDKTYSLRSVALSNSVLVVTAPGPDDGYDANSVVHRGQLNEIIEVAAAMPKIQKLRGLLRGREYNEGDDIYAEEEEDVHVRFVAPTTQLLLLL